MNAIKPVKVAIDWGSTSFRAYLFEGKSVIDKIESSCGITTVESNNPHEAFANTLHSTIGAWLTPGDSILLSGMITSANGWVETPYIPCPVDSTDIVNALLKHEMTNHTLYFVPGISQRTPHADVMRGEEVQLLGLGLEENRSANQKQLVIMPGTHSKWALIENSTVRQFRTIMTGELYGALLNHTLIGRLGTEDSWCEQTFLDTVTLGYNSPNTIGNLFTARSSVLLDAMHPSQVRAYLSGLLIGSEIREATGMLPNQPDCVTIIGTQSLTKRYLSAFKQVGINAAPAIPRGSYPDVTAAGYASIMQLASP